MPPTRRVLQCYTLYVILTPAILLALSYTCISALALVTGLVIAPYCCVACVWFSRTVADWRTLYRVPVAILIFWTVLLASTEGVLLVSMLSGIQLSDCME